MKFSNPDRKILLLNVPMMFHEYESFVNLQKNSEGTNFKDIIYYTGKVQAENGTNLLKNKYGFSMKRDFEQAMDIFCDQASLVGVAKEIEFDITKDSFIFNVYNVGFSKYYKQKYGIQKKPVDHYLRGLAAGVVQVIKESDEEFVAIETECISKGDDKCLIEVRKKKDWDLNDANVKEQMPNNKYKSIMEKQNLRQLLK